MGQNIDLGHGSWKASADLTRPTEEVSARAGRRMDTVKTSSPSLTLKSTGHGSIPEAHGQHVPIMATAEPHGGGRGNLRQWVEEAKGYPKIPWDKRYGAWLRSCHGLKFLLGQIKKF